MIVFLCHKNIALIICLLSICCGFAQSGFQIEDEKKSFKLSFEKVNNLMIIPVELNGIELSFLLDTGVDSTVLFTLPEKDSVVVNNASGIWIKGMGMDEPVEGLKSQGNLLKIGKAIHRDFTVYSVDEKHMDLSLRMGIPIHGIIGWDFFKEFIIEIKYSRDKIKVYDPIVYNSRKCMGCEAFDLKFHRNKPYITLRGTLTGASVLLNLLIDTGSGDALWLFTNEEKKLKIPKKSFPDFLGYGFGGSIYGSKSRIQKLDFGKFQLKEITASFPDTSYSEVKEEFIHRDGSLGAKILNRFKVVFDYRAKKILLKPNRKFNDPFDYDLSGVAIAHTGYKLVNEHPINLAEHNDRRFTNNEHSEGLSNNFKPEYGIVEIRPNSPADISGLEIGDIIKDINGRPAHLFSLEEIIALFSAPEGKKIKLKIERDGVEDLKAFELKQVL